MDNKNPPSRNLTDINPTKAKLSSKTKLSFKIKLSSKPKALKDNTPSMTKTTNATTTPNPSPNPHLSLNIPIIGIHHSPLTQKFGTPRQPNLVAIKSHITLFTPFDDQSAFDGIEHYSHLWLIWQFHHNKHQTNPNKSSFRSQVRPPRFGGNQKVGVFATRSMYRPAELGLSVVQLDYVQYNNNKVIALHILGADLIDGTPIIDIKPYLPYSDHIANAKSIATVPTPKNVLISPNCLTVITQLFDKPTLDTICQLIAQDPRPAYRQTQSNTRFAMRYGNVDICFYDTGQALVIDGAYVLTAN